MKDRGVLNDTPAIFTVQKDTKADPESPWYEDVSTAEEAFEKYDIFITKAAQKHKIDPDLVRAIMWAENTRGGYMGVGYRLDDIKVSKTIMPMNMYRDIWFSLISQDKTDLYDPEKNIEAGTILLKRIQARIINPTPEKIAAVWEYIGAEKTGNYPAYIGKVYREKPWIEK
jgi:soluble lytic murein transglycosylase-like protein